MKTLSFCALVMLMLVSYNGKGQSCHGKHSDNLTELFLQNGVSVAYRINHCSNGDEVSLQIANTTSLNVTVSFTEKVFSANQVWETTTSHQVNAQTVLSFPESCGQNSPLRLSGSVIFPNEYHPENNYYPEILDFQIFNVEVQ